MRHGKSQIRISSQEKFLDQIEHDSTKRVTQSARPSYFDVYGTSVVAKKVKDIPDLLLCGTKITTL